MLIFVSYLNKFDIFKSPGLWNRFDLGHMLVKGVSYLDVLANLAIIE